MLIIEGRKLLTQTQQENTMPRHETFYQSGPEGSGSSAIDQSPSENRENRENQRLNENLQDAIDAGDPFSQESQQATTENTTDANTVGTAQDTPRRLDLANRYKRETTSEQAEPTKNTVETNIENATSRLENLEGRGAEIRGKMKEKLRSTGKAIGNYIRRTGDLVLGATVTGAEKTRSYMQSSAQLAGEVKDAASQRVAQRHDRSERKRLAKERSKSDEFNTAKADEAELLAGVRAGDAKTFNYMPRGTKNERAGRRQAKQEAVDAAHAEALSMKPEEDQAAAERAAEQERIEQAAREDAERQAKEDAEYDAAADEAETFLKRLKGRKDLSITDIRRLYNDEFGTNNEEHVQAAYDESFNVFLGKKTRQAVRAARIAKGRAKAKELRTKAYEATRDTVRNSETYQRATSRSRKIGKAVVRFASRSLGAARAAKTAWQESAPKPTAESEPTNNE